MWRWALLIVLAWLALALGWSWTLISFSFNQTIQSRMGERAEGIAYSVRDRLGPAVTSPKALQNLVGDARIQQQLAWEAQQDPLVKYIMVWDPDGEVIGYADADRAAARVELTQVERLDPNQWPALDPGQRHRVVARRRLPWASLDPPATEVTVPMRTGDGTLLGFISLGVSPHWIRTQFWHTQQGVLVGTAAFAALGGAGLLIAFFVSQRTFRRMRARQQQQIQARTSLLTERGMLASVLAHEVRSPLTALRFNLHSLRNLVAAKSTDAERKMELADSCEREIRRLDLMLNDFLMRTQVVSPPEHTPVNRVVGEALDFLRPQLATHEIRTITHLDPTSPEVSVNADELRQVLLNLSANAQDAMPRGGTLAVSTVAEENSVTVLVRDSGVGIPRDVQERIFEPFFSTKPQGSGLGLALVRRVISGAGGTVFCESVEGEGTTFRVVLPRAYLEAPRPAEPMAPPAGPTDPAPGAGDAASEGKAQES